MNNQSKPIFLTQLRERVDKNGQKYFIGSLGMPTLMMKKHKEKPDVWNIFMMEPLPKEDQKGGYGGPKGSYQQSGGGYAGPDQSDDIPF